MSNESKIKIALTGERRSRPKSQFAPHKTLLEVFARDL